MLFRSSLSGTYELPFGKNKGKLMSAAIGGWSINITGMLQSGYPLSVTQPNNNSVIGTNHQRPNATGLSPAVDASFEKRIDGWLNPSAFALAPQYTFGNLSRTFGMRGPGTANFDLSVFKTFSVTEKIKAQFRAESLNVTNTPQFNGPNTTFTSSSFGVITSQANYPRLIQIGLRIFL